MIKQTIKNKLKTLFELKGIPAKSLGVWAAIAFLFLMSYIAGVNLAVALFLACLYLYFKSKRLELKIRSLLHVLLLFLINLAISYFAFRQGLPVQYIPFSVVPMLAVFLFNSLEVSLVLALANSICSAAIAPVPLQAGLFSLISGLLSGILAQNVRRRTAMIRAGLITGIVQALAIFFLDRLLFWGPARYLIAFLNGFACAIIVLGVLPVFEYLFRTVTNISLLEMADFNHPLLQRMVLEAPGTYHHSLVVGNLSETACSAIGANALLARIGAYYHDIGKLQKPGYFIENQSASESRHDALAPTMSKLIIMNHVREGVELAAKYRLSPALIDFISQHHGNSLVYYFYRRAMENLEEDQEVKEEGFRYPGPRPSTKETAVVLLADSVEAATRALKEPTPAKIEELVRKVINNKFIDGQLEECELTLKDLEKISATFIRILTGIYHSRVTYPEEPRREPRPSSR